MEPSTLRKRRFILSDEAQNSDNHKIHRLLFPLICIEVARLRS